ncbi:MAG: ATP-binding protein [Acidimicrobiia bacterium]
MTQKFLAQAGNCADRTIVTSPPVADRELIDRRVTNAPARRFRRERRFSDRMRTLGALLRWSTTLFGLGLLLIRKESLTTPAIIAIAIATGVAVWRTVRPETDHGAAGIARTGAEATLLAIAIVSTGGWESPLSFLPMATLLCVGMLWGWHGTAITLACITGAIGLGAWVFDDGWDSWRWLGQTIILMGIFGGCGTYVRRVELDNAARFRRSRDDQLRLAAANDLLATLHGVATTLSAPLDLVEVLTAARERCAQFRADHLTLLIIDDTANGWRTEIADGVRIHATHTTAELPPMVAAALQTSDPIVERDLARAQTRAFSPMSRSAVAVALRSRRTTVGVLCVEYDDLDQISNDDVSYLGGLATNLGLSIDNALWFSRLRTLGAEAERNRLARDLHDRLAQSLAYVAIELERYDKARGGSPELAHIYGVVREIVAELRSTLYELRVAPDDQRHLADLAREYCTRYSERTGITVTLRIGDSIAQLPLPVETELWRILQESLTNVERHARASRAWVTLSQQDGRASVEVRDNGCGFRPASAGTDRYGIVGMRERADAINAHFTIDSEPGAGTRVRVEVEVPA